VRFSRYFNVPDEFVIKRPRGETIGLGMIGCGCSPSDRHSWSWMREKNGVLRGQTSGTIVGRGGQDDAMRHAFDLREVADDAFEAGCAPVSAPARFAWTTTGRSSHEGEAAVLDDAPSEPVRLALEKVRAPRTCTAKP
jgi:hypothetical protein